MEGGKEGVIQPVSSPFLPAPLNLQKRGIILQILKNSKKNFTKKIKKIDFLVGLYYL
jgi:hypothetical protein